MFWVFMDAEESKNTLEAQKANKINSALVSKQISLFWACLAFELGILGAMHMQTHTGV